MDNKMAIDRKILEELNRYNSINKYIFEQDELAGGLPPAPEGDVPPAPEDAAAGAPPAPPAIEPTAPVDVENDPDVEELTPEDEGEEETEEIDITDLVTTQQEIQAKQDEFMDGIFTKLDDLESKLSNMDEIMNKINSLETKLEKYRQKSPEEKLELRSLDSYPYNQKLTDFFDDKKDEMEKSGKNEYILTSDEVENYSPNEVKKTFNLYDTEEDSE
jgi:hypothetical protein